MLQDPFWLQNVEVTPELIMNYQVKTRDMVEVLKDDMERLKVMKQKYLVYQIYSLVVRARGLEYGGREFESRSLHLNPETKAGDQTLRGKGAFWL